MEKVSVSSISWIEKTQLPIIGFTFLAGSAMSWHKKVILGLVATANPEPPKSVNNIESFIGRRQFRALTHYQYNRLDGAIQIEPIIDPGYTPPFDKSALDTRILEYIPEFLLPDSLNDQKFYRGESSPISRIQSTRLHQSSSLSVSESSQILASSLIKFRAGEHTDKIGIEDAGSPVHVPWVWCESALVREGSRYYLVMNGSAFPSHAWYVNGEQICKKLQAKLADSEKEAAINTGRPGAQPRQPDSLDRSDGRIDTHEYALGAGGQEKIDVSRFFK